MFKSNVRETWRVILVSEAEIFFTESLRILAERLSYRKNYKKIKKVLDELKEMLYDNKVFERTEHCGILAQLGEHLPYKKRVTGSSPVGPTNFLTRTQN